MEIKRGYTIREIADITNLKYKTLAERIRQVRLRPLYRVSESRGKGTGKGNLYNIDEVVRLFDYGGSKVRVGKRRRGRPRIIGDID